MLLKILLLAALVAMVKGAASPIIVGGEEAGVGDHPYGCSLQFYYSSSWNHVCGAVIWNNGHVITAAHCAEMTPVTNYRVVCGVHHLNYWTQNTKNSIVKNIIMHPEYNIGVGGYPNDIAIMELATPLQFNEHLYSYQFADENSGDFAGDNCILSGWGLTKGGGSISYTLQRVGMAAISNNKCRQTWGSSSIIDSHVCVLEPGKSSCNGDSGGPMRCGEQIVGLTSWGVIGCSPRYPSVYTRVSSFHSWITSHIGPQ